MSISSSNPGSLRPGICTSSTRPVSPYEGQQIYETDTDRTMFYNGTGWVIISEPWQSYTPALNASTTAPEPGYHRDLRGPLPAFQRHLPRGGLLPVGWHRRHHRKRNLPCGAPDRPGHVRQLHRSGRVRIVHHQRFGDLRVLGRWQLHRDEHAQQLGNHRQLHRNVVGWKWHLGRTRLQDGASAQLLTLPTRL